ncbi:hypothetical protein [Citrobacter freundii]|uniref:hypothetical protein n=1 Tax=Citrobacter freundii TaxID=546 RepID=UPI0019087B3C|nr:hypothetical protein [Citrobacter freundii]MBJ9633003.1 hypothetical protein [Citrobacter freundii]
MFNHSDHDFLANNMKIIVSSIESKLDEPFFIEYRSKAIDTISKYIAAIRKLEQSDIKRELYSNNDNEAEEFIRSHYCDLVKSIRNNDAIQIFDALRHSFSCYAYNGLHQLYTRQENESWHPKIRLTEVLFPNDIDLLNETLTLYRGCDISEFKDKEFGQAWTTSLNVAEDFAYNHYSGQEWFDTEKRVVLKTTYSKNHVLFSDQSIEYEVAIDTKKLDHVQRYK